MSKPWVHNEQKETPEATTVVINVTTIEDESVPPQILGAADLDSLTATIYEKGSRSIVGDWSDKDVLGVNGGVFVGNTFRLKLGPTDTEPLFPARKGETWVVMFRWTYNGIAADVGHQEVVLPLVNRPHVPVTS